MRSKTHYQFCKWSYLALFLVLPLLYTYKEILEYSLTSFIVASLLVIFLRYYLLYVWFKPICSACKKVVEVKTISRLQTFHGNDYGYAEAMQYCCDQCHEEVVFEWTRKSSKD
jgi:uncharacterized protein YlaI